MHTVTLTVSLFALTLLVPGPNMLFVIRSSLACGRTAGIAAGLGIATGDAIYAALGLASMVAIVGQGGTVLQWLRVVGSGFLLWTAWTMTRDRRLTVALASEEPPKSGTAYFVSGLATDLANPQTFLFFASIFGATLPTGTPSSVKTLAWAAIGMTSVVWRLFLAVAFATPSTRRLYERHRQVLSVVAGALMAIFALRLLAGALWAWDE